MRRQLEEQRQQQQLELATQRELEQRAQREREKRECRKRDMSGRELDFLRRRAELEQEAAERIQRL